MLDISAASGGKNSQNYIAHLGDAGHQFNQVCVLDRDHCRGFTRPHLDHRHRTGQRPNFTGKLGSPHRGRDCPLLRNRMHNLYLAAFNIKQFLQRITGSNDRVACAIRPYRSNLS